MRRVRCHVLCRYILLIQVKTSRSNDNALTDAIFQAEKTYQHIDGLILNAGVLDPVGCIGDDTTIASWRNHFDVNFFSHVTALKAALPSLRQSLLGARVIFISSGNSVKGPLGMGPYNASKAAVNSLCRYVNFVTD
jgi:NAD(P)-dependent dehydrogenase (short-subunit alcohol dehydrogenase family)